MQFPLISVQSRHSTPPPEARLAISPLVTSGTEFLPSALSSGRSRLNLGQSFSNRSSPVSQRRGRAPSTPISAFPTASPSRMPPHSHTPASGSAKFRTQGHTASSPASPLLNLARHASSPVSPSSGFSRDSSFDLLLYSRTEMAANEVVSKSGPSSPQTPLRSARPSYSRLSFSPSPGPESIHADLPVLSVAPAQRVTTPPALDFDDDDVYIIDDAPESSV